MSNSIDLELYCGDEMVAAVSGPRARAIAEMRHYAAQYSEDGPLVVYRVERHAFDLRRGEDCARAEAKAKQPQCKCEMTDIARKCGVPCPGMCPAFDDDGKGICLGCEHRRACHAQQEEAAK